MHRDVNGTGCRKPEIQHIPEYQRPASTQHINRRIAS